MRVLVDLLAPPLCGGCDERAAPPWCGACDARAVALRPTVPCPRCAGAAGTGHPCWSGTSPVERLVALTAWRDPVARAVLHAKLEGRAEVFAALGPRLAALVDDPPDAVVAVPTDPRRARRRGADHTRVLAAAVAAALRRPVVGALRVGRPMPDRGRAVAAHRAVVPADAFVARRPAARLVGAHVLLVDDVVTTGGTLAAAVRRLRDHRVRQVAAAVVARAGGHVLRG